MSIGLAADDDPIDYRNLPPRRDARVANRLVPTRRAVPFPKRAALLASVPVAASGAFAASGLLGLGSMEMSDRLLILGASALPLAGVWVWHRWQSWTRSRVHFPPLASQFPTWDSITRALQTSPHEARLRGETVRERDHVFLGCHAGTSKPVLLHEEYFKLPAIIVGRTGIGKTKRVIQPLLVQAIRRGEIHAVVLDYKGDRGLFMGLAAEAARARKDFKYLTIEPGKSSYLWNPFIDPAVSLLSRDQFTQIFLRSSSLVTGQEGGPGYFGAQSEERTRRTFEQVWPRSAREFYRIVREQRASDIGLAERDFANTGHLVANLARIASVGVLNAVPGDDVPQSALREAISLLGILSRPGVTYFNLPAQLEPTTALFVGKLLIHLLAAVAKVYAGHRVQVLLCNDEAQELVAGSTDLATPLRQARESRITIWMGFQDLAALRTAQGDFAPALLANAPLKVFCSAEDTIGRDYLMRTSGETTRTLRSVTDTATSTPNGGTNGRAVQRRQEATPRIDAETINRVNRDPHSFILVASESKGYTQFRFPAVVRSGFHISKQAADRMAALPWPRGNRFTVTVKVVPAEPQPVAAPPEQAPTVAEIVEPPAPTEQAPAAPEPAPEPTPARRRGRPRRAVQVEAPPSVPEGLENNEMAQYLKKLAGEVPLEANSEGGP